MKTNGFFAAMPTLTLASGILLGACVSNPASGGGNEVNSRLYEMVMKLGYAPHFTLTNAVKLDWAPVPQEVAANDKAYGPAGENPNATGHPQGMVRVKDGTFWISTVYVTTPTSAGSPTPDEKALGMDRGTGAGVGYVVNFDATGKEIKRVKIGEGTIYHPGGIDYDGTYIWVPAAEYRPNSYSIIYRVDPEAPPAAAAVKVMEVPDHIGGILHDLKNKTLIGNTWGSRRFYTWPLNDDGTVSKTSWSRAELAGIKVLNPSSYVDYQDNMYVGNGKMIAAGVGSGDTGGIEVVDCKTGLIENQIRILTRVNQGAVPSPAGITGTRLCQNPFWLELSPDGTGITAYFAPEDDSTFLYIFSLEPGTHPNA